MEKYNVIEWEYQAYIENEKIILSSAKATVHKVRLENDECIYIVPEDFYLNCKNQLKQKKETNVDENNERNTDKNND